MTVILKKDGAPARQWLPFAQYCRKEAKTVLEAGKSRYAPLFIGAGRNGWDLAEPGRYTVQVAMQAGRRGSRLEPAAGADRAAARLRRGVPRAGLLHRRGRSRARLRRQPRAGPRQRRAARDGRQAADRRVAHHALVALAKPLARAGKMLALPDKDGATTMAPAAEAGGKIKVAKAKPEEARKQLNSALMKEENVAAETLGHIEYHDYVDQYSDWLAAQGDPNAAAKCQTSLLSTLKARKVADWVLSAIQKKRDSYKKK